MNDNRAISDMADDFEIIKTPTIGEFIHKTLDMQTETLAIVDNIIHTMWGDETRATTAEPKENIMAGLAAIQENQRTIMMAVKDIVNKL